MIPRRVNASATILCTSRNLPRNTEVENECIEEGNTAEAWKWTKIWGNPGTAENEARNRDEEGVVRLQSSGR